MISCIIIVGRPITPSSRKWEWTTPELLRWLLLTVSLDLNGLKIENLVYVAQVIFSKSTPKLELHEVVGSPKVTIREKISLIANYLRHHARASFHHLVSNKSLRLDIVVTFLALLELVKLHLVNVKQESNFGEIIIAPSESWDDSTNFEIEFGE